LQGQEPFLGGKQFSFTKPVRGDVFCEAEVHFPDGRRVFATKKFSSSGK